MGLSLNCLFSCLRVLKYIVQFSSLDPIFFFGIWGSLDFTSFSSVLSHLIKCGFDLDTVHLASRYSLSIVHLFMVCGMSWLTTKVQQHLCCWLIVQCSLWASTVVDFPVLMFTDPRHFLPVLSLPFVPYILRLLAASYTYKILIHCITSLYIQ